MQILLKQPLIMVNQAFLSNLLPKNFYQKVLQDLIPVSYTHLDVYKSKPPNRHNPIATNILLSILLVKVAVKIIAVILPKPLGIIVAPLKNAVYPNILCKN